ncbi:uncharacterized protein LOC126656878 [Mercurialis annua]|uniref:uncharacterized protein LOC126656878 n=1 Tax=Mercurialis annua TaxID=3986 RepID=UPI002160BC91|nr:uncharacterized protein LOC126656878 [Mercurialis annua]
MACVTNVKYTSIGLTSLLMESGRQNRLHGIAICRNAPSISYLFFADDCYLFFRENLEEMVEVKEILGRYEKASRQRVNFNKLNLMFNRNFSEMADLEIVAVMNVKLVVDQGKYLGLPSFIGRNKRQIFQYFKDKISHRVKWWNAKFLSRGGKEFLIKAVAQYIPNYIMNLFLIPVGLCEELERMMNSFW